MYSRLCLKCSGLYKARTPCVVTVKPVTKKDKQTLRMVFEAWREYSVDMQTRRFRKDLPIEQRGKFNALHSTYQTLCFELYAPMPSSKMVVVMLTLAGCVVLHDACATNSVSHCMIFTLASAL